MLRGIRGISEELEQLVEGLPLTDLAKVAGTALEVVADEYPDDADIRETIELYGGDPNAARAQAEELSEKSRECDEAYCRLEGEGKTAASEAMFRKMCLLNGLSSLLAAASLTPQVVDDLVYDLGHGVADTDLFAKRMIERFRSVGQDPPDTL